MQEIESVSGVVDEKTGVLTGQGIVECIIRDLQHHVNFRYIQMYLQCFIISFHNMEIP